jgi:tyrosyl-tRNA synthetase
VFRSEFLRTLQERGFIFQQTDPEQLDQLCQVDSVTGYIGFDATAKSLQVGNLSAIMMLRWLQKCGHKPLVLVGGGTSRVGDPSFRQKARPLASLEQIHENIQGISRVFSTLINFQTGSNRAELVNNADWLTELKYIDFLRDFGSLFTVNRMLSFESVKTRLDKEEPLSFLEFNYMLMQAYDFYYLHKNYNCVLQMGGSDQWGNIVNGVELVRKLSQRGAFGLTAPLVTNASGQKMGKTADGAVWLNADMCSPYDYWQFWRNTDDRDVGVYLRKFTDLPIADILRLEKLNGAETNEAKKILADEATALIHGRNELDRIHAAAGALFGEDRAAADGQASQAGNDSIPTFTLRPGQLPIFIDDLFVLTQLCDSKSEFKRLIEGKGARFRQDVIHDSKMSLNNQDFQPEGVLLAVGKKKYLRVVVQE